VTTNIGSKETAMPMRRYKRIALAQFLMGGLAVIFIACILIKQTQAQFVNSPPPPPPPVLNPSSPNTVPQPRYSPIAPATPSVAPGYRVTAPTNGHLPRTATRSHQRTSVAKTRSVHRRGRSIGARRIPESYSHYYSSFGDGYGCAWRRTWDGYWFRTSPCS
jgi:hypothetical protein